MFKKLLKIGFALGLAVMMAEVERAKQEASVAGVVPTVIEGMSAADTQIIPNDGRTVLRVNNGWCRTHRSHNRHARRSNRIARSRRP
jgi:hypothetical protein